MSGAPGEAVSGSRSTNAPQTIDLTTPPPPSYNQADFGGDVNQHSMLQGPPQPPSYQTTPMYILAPTFTNGVLTGHVAGTFVPLPAGETIPTSSGRSFCQPVDRNRMGPQGHQLSNLPTTMPVLQQQQWEWYQQDQRRLVPQYEKGQSEVDYRQQEIHQQQVDEQHQEQQGIHGQQENQPQRHKQQDTPPLESPDAKTLVPESFDGSDSNMPEVDLPSDTEYDGVEETASESSKTVETTSEKKKRWFNSYPSHSKQAYSTAPTTTPTTTPLNPLTSSESSNKGAYGSEPEMHRYLRELGSPVPHSDNPRLQRLNKLKRDVNELFKLSESDWKKREDGQWLPPHPTMPAVKVVTAETDTDSICENLKLLPLRIPLHCFPEDTNIRGGFPSVEEAIYWSMRNASTLHYQLVPRYDEKSEIWTLHCDRMAADDIDKLQEEQYVAVTRKLHELELNEDRHEPIPYKKCHCKIERGSPRKSCDFKMTVVKKKDDNGIDRFIVEPPWGESRRHNHRASVDISAHEFDNQPLYEILSKPKYTDRTGLLEIEERKRKGFCDPGSSEYSTAFSRMINGHLHMKKQKRLNKRDPFEVTRELISNPLLRGAFQIVGDRISNKSIFFAHTQGLMWWRAYPEVVIIDSKWEQRISDQSYYRAVSIRCVSSQNEEIPICVCLTEKTGSDIKKSVWEWILQQYIKLLQEFKIALPTYIQTDSDDNLLTACNKIIPTVLVQLEGQERIAKSAEMRARPSPDTFSQRQEVLRQWEEIINAPDETTMCTLLTEAKLRNTIFFGKAFATLEQRLLKPSSKAFKNAGKHYHVMPMSETREGFTVEKPLNILELVRGILKDIVDSYEKLTESYAKLSVYTEPGYDHFYLHVLHHISYLALKRVRDADRSVLDSPCACSNQGYPCVHEISYIKQRGRKLAVDDFHPHWRNIFSDLHAPNLCGGRYQGEWSQIEIGPRKFLPEDGEEGRAAKRVRRE